MQQKKLDLIYLIHVVQRIKFSKYCSIYCPRAGLGELLSVSLFVSVCVSFDFPLNFTMVMGSFTWLYGPIPIDQSESRIVISQLTDQSEFLDNFTMQLY